MEFPKDQIDAICKKDHDSEEDLSDATSDVVVYAEFANARIKELEAACNELMLKIRMIAQVLK